MTVDVPSDPTGVLELALKNEQKTFELYEEAAEAAQSDLARRTFEFLSGEERRHIDQISKYYKATAESRDFTEVTPTHTANDAKRQLASIFDRFQLDVVLTQFAKDQTMEAYQVGLEIEKSGHAYYTQAAKQANSEFARAFYTWLANEESAHYELLDQTYSFLQRPEGYLSEMERWMQI